jgi:hypothetical protein
MGWKDSIRAEEIQRRMSFMEKTLVTDADASSKATKRCLGKKPPETNGFIRSRQLELEEHYRQALIEAGEYIENKIIMGCREKHNLDGKCDACVWCKLVDDIRKSAGVK